MLKFSINFRYKYYKKKMLLFIINLLSFCYVGCWLNMILVLNVCYCNGGFFVYFYLLNDWLV